MSPAYELSNLITNCIKKTGSRPWVRGVAMHTARADFNLNTQKAVVDFIGSGGLENPQFINSILWRNNPDPSRIMVDAYSFFSGYKFGYIAFYYSLNEERWVIKSFKNNESPDPRNLAFKGLGKLLK